MIDLPQPRIFIAGAAIALIVGVALLILGYYSLAPLGFFVAIVATILAAIAITTPHVPSIEELEAAQQPVVPIESTSPHNDERPSDESPGAQA